MISGVDATSQLLRYQTRQPCAPARAALQRGLNYVAYLRHLDPHADVITATFAGGHNNSGAFFSDAQRLTQGVGVRALRAPARGGLHRLHDRHVTLDRDNNALDLVFAHPDF